MTRILNVSGPTLFIATAIGVWGALTWPMWAVVPYTIVLFAGVVGYAYLAVVEHRNAR